MSLGGGGAGVQTEGKRLKLAGAEGVGQLIWGLEKVSKRLQGSGQGQEGDRPPMAIFLSKAAGSLALAPTLAQGLWGELSSPGGTWTWPPGLWWPLPTHGTPFLLLRAARLPWVNSSHPQCLRQIQANYSWLGWGAEVSELWGHSSPRAPDDDHVNGRDTPEPQP